MRPVFAPEGFVGTRHAVPPKAEPPPPAGAALGKAAGLAGGMPGAGHRDAPALAALVREAVTAGVTRHALHLRLSRLAGRLNRGHHHRLVREALEPLLNQRRAGLFELPNADLVVLSPAGGAPLAAVQAALTTLLVEDLSETPVLVLELPAHAAALLASIEQSLVTADGSLHGSFEGSLQRSLQGSLQGTVHGLPAESPPVGRFGSAALATIERDLANASLEQFLRRHAICHLPAQADRPEPAWQEWRLDWTALRAAVFPDVDPAAAPWLQRRLLRLLDRRRLAELARPELVQAMGPTGLPLAVASLTHPAFLRFDSMLGRAGRAQVTIALDGADVLADPEGFGFARDFCQARGYRLALDVAEAATALLLPVDRLGLDLLQLRWSPTLPGLAGLAAALPQPRSRIVLTGVDRAAAIGWGWQEGVELFEGPLLAPRLR